MITLDDLRFIDALDRTGSLSAAARSLNVTPPALSMRLKKLERLLSINLVVRSSRHVRFTSEGERLVAEAQRLLEQINALPDALAGEGRSLAGRLHVVSSFGFGRIHVAPLIATICGRVPFGARDAGSVGKTLDRKQERRRRHPYRHGARFVLGGASPGTKRTLAVREPGLSSSPRRSLSPARPAGARVPVRARKRRGRDIVALSQWRQDA